MENRLREIRELQGLSQQELADKSGVSRVTISNIERGAAPDLKYTTMDRISQAVNLPISKYQESTQKDTGRIFTAGYVSPESCASEKPEQRPAERGGQGEKPIYRTDHFSGEKILPWLLGHGRRSTRRTTGRRGASFRTGSPGRDRAGLYRG